MYTPQVLSILEKYDITAAFSMVGENVTYYPSIAREVADAGHTIVNHTWNHANLMSMSGASCRRRSTGPRTRSTARRASRPRMFRAPYGVWSPTA